jgi:hypothetical protein
MLRQCGLSPQIEGDLTAIAAADACGVVIAFQPPGAPLA